MPLGLISNIFDWYWVVGDTNPTTQVFSSATSTMVANTAAAYVTWVGTNGSGSQFISGAADNGAGLIRLTVENTNDMATNDRWVVTGVLGTTEANGTWPITVIDATHVDLQGSAFVHAYTSGGYFGHGQPIDTLVNVYAAINNFNVSNWNQNSAYLASVTLVAGTPLVLTNTLARTYTVKAAGSDGAILQLPAANLPGAPPLGQPIVILMDTSVTHFWELNDATGANIREFGARGAATLVNLDNTTPQGHWVTKSYGNVNRPGADAQILISQTNFAQDQNWYNVTPSGDVTLSDTGVFAVAKIGGAAPRQPLSAGRTYFVRTDGSDSNTGLVNSAGGAFATIQKAWDTIVTLDLMGFTATIQIADGTYNQSPNATVAPVGGPVVINGNSSTPANVVVNGGNTLVFNCPCTVTVQNFEIRASNNGLQVQNGALVNIGVGMRFGACTNIHMTTLGSGYIFVAQDYSIVGAAANHYYPNLGGTIELAVRTITNVGTNAFGNGFAGANMGGKLSAFGCTYTGGTITGPRYNVTAGGLINTFAGGANYFPGNAVGIGGTTAGGGFYS